MKNKISKIRLLMAILVSLNFVNIAFANDIKIVGIKYDGSAGKRTFVQYNPYTDDVSLNKDLPFLNFVFGTSTYDPSTSKYYISTWNVMANEKRIYGIYSPFGEVIDEVDTKLYALTESEYDFKTGELCGFVNGNVIEVDTLTNDTIVGLNFVKINPNTGELSVIGEIKEFNGPVLNTSCYNSNKGIFIVSAVNLRKDDRARIYWIDANTGKVINTSEPLDYNIGELLYDNKNDRLIGYKNDENGGSLVTINEKGEATPISDFKIKGYVASNTAFDQKSSCFVASILEENSTSLQTIVINTLTGKVESNIKTEHQINEWEVDNTEFARLFYKTASVNNEVEVNNIQVSPNPTKSNFIEVSGLEGTYKVRVFNLIGMEVLNIEVSEKQRIDVSTLENGSYRAILTNGNSTKEVQFIVAK